MKRLSEDDRQALADILDAAFQRDPGSRRDYALEAATDNPALRDAVARSFDSEMSMAFMTGLEADDFDRDPSLDVGTELGSWRITGTYGAGGMGEVYAVERRGGYEQAAALKIVNGRWADLDAEWFLLERQTLAKLEHPGIAHLLDGGKAPDGRPYFVMERIDGRPLCDAVVADARPLDARLRLFRQLLRALSHAHARFVLHRDIKPANVLLTQEGYVKLLDFGLSGTGLADADSPLTPGYGAPELAADTSADARTDVWGAGTVLFEMLTGCPPFRPSEVLTGHNDSISRTASEATVSVPSKQLAGDLDAILNMALARDPDDRYSSVDDFAADIDRYLAREPVKARRSTPAYRLERYLARNSWQSAAIAGVFIALSVGMAGTLWQAAEARSERDFAQREEAKLRAMQQATFHMFADAGSRSESLNARELVQSSADRIRQEFQDDPAASGPVLRMFGEMFYMMNDYEAAELLLSNVAASDAVDPLTRAAAQHELASAQVRMGKFDAATEQLSDAQAFWSQRPERFREELLESRLPEAEILTGQGNVEGARTLLRQTVEDRQALSDVDSRETMVLMNALGAANFRLGNVEEALENYGTVRTVIETLGLENSPDGLNVMNNIASINFVLQRFEEARTAFAEAATLRRELYGPSTALAVLLMNGGKAELETGRTDEAVALYAQSVPMAVEFAGASSPPALAARAGYVDALVRQGETDTAIAQSERAFADLEGTALDASIYGGIVRLSIARAMDAAGRKIEALEMIDGAIDRLEAAGPQATQQVGAARTIRDNMMR